MSHIEGDVDWKGVASAGVRFAILKATEGIAFRDPRYCVNVERAIEAGIQVGAYHFVHLDEDGSSQAEFFMKMLDSAFGRGEKIYNGRIGVVLDLEDDPSMPGLASHIGRDGIRKLIEDFSNTIHTHTGLLPMIYGSPGWLDEWVGDGFGGHPLWVSHYDVPTPRLPIGWTDWKVWQYRADGTVPGITGDVDRNLWHGQL